MARCEDFPCCGHELGDCPTIDSKGRQRFTCVECGKRLPAKAPSSICAKCQRTMARRSQHPDYDPEYRDYDPSDY